MSELVQGTDEWLQARVGKVTASRIADLMARLRDKKTPIIPVSSMSMKMRYSFILSLIEVQEDIIAMGKRKTVRITRRRLIPSIPT